MKCIMVMFDSLNRHMLPPYGGTFVHGPNFTRLAERAVTFDRSYVCSMPCMPARRDMHTGRPNFLHRSWGPLEPFDDSMPEILKRNQVWSHFATDHYHYFEDGGCTYHTRYQTWEFFRGQEGDPWIGQVGMPDCPETFEPEGRKPTKDNWSKMRQDWANRAHMTSVETQSQGRTFRAGLDFLERNKNEDNWFLTIETFDPHEPFFSQPEFKKLYKEHYDNYDGPHMDWPPYSKVHEPREVAEHCRHEYAALMSMCDMQMGRVLDAMDQYDLWDDTMLIVWTDHGFLLGEHDSWAKCWLPLYEENSHTPFFVWDPRCGKRGERRQALVQPSIDVGPTILDFFGLEPTKDMTGKVLRDTIAEDKKVRDAAMFGLFGQQVCVTDGRYVYMRGPTGDNAPLTEYTVMPTHMVAPFKPEELKEFSVAGPLSFTKEAKVMAIPTDRPAVAGGFPDTLKTMLWDLETDPGQTEQIEDATVEKMMTDHLVTLFKENDAPAEQYERLGLSA